MDSRARELLDLLASDEGRENPYPLYQRLRENPPLYDDRHKAVLVSRYTDCRKALTDKSFGRPDLDFLERRIPAWRDHPSAVCASRMMQFGDRRSHPRRRGSVSGFFMSRRVREMVAFEAGKLDKVMDGLASELDANEEVDLQKSLSDRLPNISMSALFGVSESELRHLQPVAFAVGSLLEPGISREQIAQVDDAVRKLDRYFRELIQSRRETPTDDLASFIVQCSETNPATLAEDELVPMFVSLYAAGTINTGNFISNGIAALLSAPREAERLRHDPSLDDAAVNEILRYEAPLQITRRIALREVELGGRTLHAGTHLAVILGSANRDPAVYTDPDIFRIGRQGPPQLGFGGGAFHCLGAALGRLEGALVFRKLITRFPDLRLGSKPTRNRRFVNRGYLHLPVTTRLGVTSATNIQA